MCNPGQASVRKDPLFNLSCVLQFEKKHIIASNPRVPQTLACLNPCTKKAQCFAEYDPCWVDEETVRAA